MSNRRRLSSSLHSLAYDIYYDKEDWESCNTEPRIPSCAALIVHIIPKSRDSFAYRRQQHTTLCDTRNKINESSKEKIRDIQLTIARKHVESFYLMDSLFISPQLFLVIYHFCCFIGDHVWKNKHYASWVHFVIDKRLCTLDIVWLITERHLVCTFAAAAVTWTWNNNDFNWVHILDRLCHLPNFKWAMQ